MSQDWKLRCLFGGFAVLIACRDVFAESPYKEQPATFAFYIAFFIVLVCGGIVLANRGHETIPHKMRQPGVAVKATILGALAAVIYLITFIFLEKLGAGDFDLVDYGLAPVLTAAIGYKYFQGERPTVATAGAFVFYSIGLWLITRHFDKSDLAYLPLAILSPAATAVSDGLSKWLLNVGQLTRSELLLIRFLPACPILGFASYFMHGSLTLHASAISVPVILLTGFLPLWLLCTGLGKGALARYAAWEFLIPATAFVGTLHWHPDHLTWPAAFGACLILLALVASEVGVSWTASIKKALLADSVS